jgi:hypothetical protein
VTSTATKHANKNFLSRLGDFSPHFSLGVEGWLWIGWVVSFGGFDCFLYLVIVGARNKLGSTLPTLILTSLKPNSQVVSRFCCTLSNSAQVILYHFLTQLGFLKTYRQVGNLLL